MTKSLKCRVGLHSWKREHNQAGEPYRRCRLCGKDDDTASRVRAAGG
jgi:hypothetical protein